MPYNRSRPHYRFPHPAAEALDVMFGAVPRASSCRGAATPRAAPAFFRPLAMPGLNVSGGGGVQQQQHPYEGGDHGNPSRSGPGDYAPRFDLREWEHYYELIGELPGADREDLSVFMADPHHLVVHGRVEHDLAGLFDPEVIKKKQQQQQQRAARELVQDEPKPAQDGPESTQDEPEPAALDEEEEDDGVLVGDDEHDETSSNKSYQATVEDAADDEDLGGSQATSSAQPTPATTAAETESTKAAETGRPPSAAAAAAETALPRPPRMPEYKPLVKERNFGSFWRTFRLPTLVDEDRISATLKDGNLRVTVQKAKRTEPRLIPIYT